MTDENLAERTALAAAYADLNDRIEQLEASRSAVRARLIDLGPGPAGPLTVRVTSQRRLNVDRFAARFPAAEFPALWEEKPRTAAVKGLGQDDLYDEGSVALRVVEAD